MDLEQLLAEIAKHPINTVLEALKKTSFYQPIFNDGHGVATKAFRDDLTKKDKEIERLTKERVDLQTEYDKFKEKNPSAAELQRQYSDAIAAKDKEIETLKAQHNDEKKKWRVDDVLTRIQNELSKVIDPEIVEGRAAKLRDRIQLSDGNTVQIMQAGQQIPFAGDLDAQIKTLVEEVKKAVPERFHVSNVHSGSGRDTAAGGTNGKKGFYEEIRNSVKAPEKPEGQPAPQDRLNARMGLRPT